MRVLAKQSTAAGFAKDLRGRGAEAVSRRLDSGYAVYARWPSNGASGTRAVSPVPYLPDKRRRRREALGLSQQQLASRLGIGAATLCRWEQGTRDPSPEAEARWKRALAALEQARRTPAPARSPEQRSEAVTYARKHGLTAAALEFGVGEDTIRAWQAEVVGAERRAS